MTTVTMSATTPEINVQDLRPPVAAVARLSRELTSLLTEETRLLKEKRTRELQATAGEKARLIAEYRKAIGIVRVNEESLLGPKGSPERQFIQSVTEMLRGALKDHARMVLRLKTVTEGLVKAIGEEVGKRNGNLPGYTRGASSRADNPVRPTSLALDQRI